MLHLLHKFYITICYNICYMIYAITYSFRVLNGNENACHVQFSIH